MKLIWTLFDGFVPKFATTEVCSYFLSINGSLYRINYFMVVIIIIIVVVAAIYNLNNRIKTKNKHVIKGPNATS